MKIIEVTYPLLILWAIYIHIKVHLHDLVLMAKIDDNLTTDTEIDTSNKKENTVNSDFTQPDEIRKKILVPPTSETKDFIGPYELKHKKERNSKVRERSLYYYDEVTSTTTQNLKKADIKIAKKLPNNQRKLSTKAAFHHTATTYCILMEENDPHNNDENQLSPFALLLSERKDDVKIFNISLQVMTDIYPELTSWTLAPQSQGESNEFIINSNDKFATNPSQLMKNFLHNFEYSCAVQSYENNGNENHYEVSSSTSFILCYDFYVRDGYGIGMCCAYGMGHFIMNINTDSAALTVKSDGVFSNSMKSSFCVTENDAVYGQTIFITDSRNNEENTAHNNSLEDVSTIFSDTENYNISTKCFLSNNSDSHLNGYLLHQDYDEEVEDFVTSFNLTLNVFTDRLPHQTNWKLLSNNNAMNSVAIIIDSTAVNTTPQLLKHTLHNFEYICEVFQNRDKRKHDHVIPMNKICYEFELHDSNIDGLCCQYGVGYYDLFLNNDSKPFISDRLYSLISSHTFCLDQNDRNDGHLNTDNLYPSRECINEVCICDSNPSLSYVNNQDAMYDTKIQTLMEVIMSSSYTKSGLLDFNSPQYKAACWTLHDDPFWYENERKNNLTISMTQETRIIQRYVLALFYFTLTPESWTNHFNFLSKRSECEWNNQLEFYNNDVDRITGITCDENQNILSITLPRNNLEGTIIDELFRLKSLEQIFLAFNKLHGTLPSSLGRLSELRYLGLFSNSLEGTIPSQLFDATKKCKMQSIYLGGNSLTGKIPQSIGNCSQLSLIWFQNNNLTGPIPSEIYSLKLLMQLFLEENKLSSSISPLVGDLKKLRELRINNNMISGQIPSIIFNSKSLEDLHLNSNTLSGPIPHSLENGTKIRSLRIQNNSVTGSISDEYCENEVVLEIAADCRNDVVEPEVSCTCHKCICTDKTPLWDGDCADSNIQIIVDHKYSNGLSWALKEDATDRKVLFDSIHEWEEEGESVYSACVAQSSCLSLTLLSPPRRDTPFRILWNNEIIHTGVFPSWFYNDDINEDDPPKTLLQFQYDSTTKGNLTTCTAIRHTCDEDVDQQEVIFIKPHSTQRIMYDLVSQISGTDIIKDTLSSRSKTLCWFLKNDENDYFEVSEVGNTEFIQRYILTLLHVMSPEGLFGTKEFPPESHECDWDGIICGHQGSNNSTTYSRIVTGISLNKNQIIEGTLVQEIGNLAYLGKLKLDQSKLSGTIPRVFSNLWSLAELDLSENNLTGTIPSTLFSQLRKIEHVLLFENSLSGTVPRDVSNNPRIRTMALDRNKLTGSIALDGFQEKNNLEHFDISENEFSGLNFTLLSKHRNLKTLNVASNFLAGNLPRDLFESMHNLEYLNISQNQFSGVLPQSYPKLSSVTCFDAHANNFKGTIPQELLRELSSIEHLNLQGNQLTGSISSHIISLKKLETLVLSHNKLKGSIPLGLNELQYLQRLHLHNNKLSGEAPKFTKMRSYITDCGFPTDSSLDPVKCNTCNKCCNSDGACQAKRSSSRQGSLVIVTIFFIFSMISLISSCYVLKEHITSNKSLESFFSKTVSSWNALMLMNDKSVYHFLLTKNKIKWYIGFFCGVFQIATLFLFVHSADMANRNSDKEYTFKCPSNTLECEDSKHTTAYGFFIFILILVIWLLRDIISSVKLLLCSLEKKNIDFFFASGLLFVVTTLSLWTSVTYIIAIVTKNTDLIKDAVVLLFVIEIDERLFQLVESIEPEWVRKIDENMSNSRVYEGKDLVLSTWINKSLVSGQKTFQRLEHFGKGFVNTLEQKKVKEEKDKIEEEEEEIYVEATGDYSL